MQSFNGFSDQIQKSTSYNNPTQVLVIISTDAFGEKQEQSEAAKHPSTATLKTLRRPQASESMPQKCELKTTPIQNDPLINQQ